MKMEQIKPIATATFNTLVSDTDAQQYFTDAFDLWQGCESLYDDSNNAYKAIIRRYAQPINEEVGRIRLAMSNDATKRIKAVNDSTTTENGSTDRTINKTLKADTNQNNGQLTQTVRKYPNGYVTAPDAAYLAAETIDSPQENSTKFNSVGIDTENVQDSKNVIIAGSGDTEETDELARAQLLTYSAELAKLIEGCVYKFVANTITEGRNEWD